jgi:hypothetical protein
MKSKNKKEIYDMQEQWKIIEEAENYEVSNLGNVRNIVTNKILKGRISAGGYPQVSIKIDAEGRFKNRYIHRLVALYWIDNPDNKEQVNHKDGNKMNNVIDNLEWVTSSENLLHKSKLYGKDLKTSNRRVGQYTKTGELVAEFDSIKAAAASVGSPRVSVDAALNGRVYTLKGFVWKYLD